MSEKGIFTPARNMSFTPPAGNRGEGLELPVHECGVVVTHMEEKGDCVAHTYRIPRPPGDTRDDFWCEALLDDKKLRTEARCIKLAGTKVAYGSSSYMTGLPLYLVNDKADWISLEP